MRTTIDKAGRLVIAAAVRRARVIVTDNRRHFIAALKHGIRVETPAEFMAGEKRRR